MELGVTWDDVLAGDVYHSCTSINPSVSTSAARLARAGRQLQPVSADVGQMGGRVHRWLGQVPVPVSETADPADDYRHTAARGRVSPVSAATGSDGSEFARAMGPVARAILGEPTECNRQKGELRFGSRGSLSVDLGAGTWFDHEVGAGGGVLDFVQLRMNTDKAGAVTWLQEHGHIEKPKQKLNIVATYDYVAADGDPLFQVVRFAPKDFRQRRSDGNGGWLWNMKNIQRSSTACQRLLASRQAAVFMWSRARGGRRSGSARANCNVFTRWRQ